MASTVGPEARERVLSQVRDLSPEPTKLLQALEAELSYREVQDALTELLRSDNVELGSDQHLRITEPTV